MIKVFIQDHNNIKGASQVKIFNEEKQTVKCYYISKTHGFPFGSQKEVAVKDWGYNTVTEAITSLKRRKQLGDSIEINDLRAIEKIGYINLGIERIKRAGRINTSDFEDVCEKLSSYGLGFVDAQNQIIETYINE